MVFKKTKWVAAVRGQRWTIAKVAQHKRTLNILSMGEYAQDESVSNDVQISQLRAWLKHNNVPLKKLQLAVSCPGVITRIITLPVLSSKDLDKLLTDQVAQYFTFNIEDYIVDYRIVEQIEVDGQQRQNILLTALPKYYWESMWTTWEEFGLSPKVVDLAADCIARLFSQLNQEILKKEPKEQPRDLAIVDINSDRVEFLLLEHGVFFLYSDMEVAFSDLSQSLRERVQKAEDSSSIHQELEQSISTVLRTLAEFLSFFAMRHFGKPVDGIYLTGELADLPFLTDVFETEFGIPTHCGFLNDWKPAFGRKTKDLAKDWSKFGSLYGLALRED